MSVQKAENKTKSIDHGTREKILEAADGLFGKVGFDAATTREIAEASGVNKALIHYHFKSKSALFEAVLDRYYRRLNETFQSALSREGSMRHRLEQLIDAYVDFLSENRNFSRIVQRESSGGKHIERVRQNLLPMFRLGSRMIMAAYPKTSSGDMAAHQLIVSFYGMIVSYFTYSPVLEHLIDKNPLAKEEIEARKRHLAKMLEIVLNEIGRNGQDFTSDKGF